MSLSFPAVILRRINDFGWLNSKGGVVNFHNLQIGKAGQAWESAWL